jgi:hypothetical protein
MSYARSIAAREAERERERERGGGLWKDRIDGKTERDTGRLLKTFR